LLFRGLDTYNFLAILAILLSVGIVPIITTLLFAKASHDDLESKRELLAIAVEVEKAATAWRARHQTPDRESHSVSTFDTVA
jgi:uncharacterized membrane protein YccC